MPLGFPSPDVQYTVAVAPDDGGYFGRVLELPGCFTQGATPEEVLDRVPEAIRCHLEAGAPRVSIGIHQVEA